MNHTLLQEKKTPTMEERTLRGCVCHRKLLTPGKELEHLHPKQRPPPPPTRKNSNLLLQSTVNNLPTERAPMKNQSCLTICELTVLMGKLYYTRKQEMSQKQCELRNGVNCFLCSPQWGSLAGLSQVSTIQVSRVLRKHLTHARAHACVCARARTVVQNSKMSQ